MQIVLSSDHAGANLKREIARFLQSLPLITGVSDVFGTTEEKSDYPEAALKATNEIIFGSADRGILFCGSGIGMAIAANKVPGIRAVCASDATMARLARQHNNCNVLTLGERLCGIELAHDIVRVFLETSFEGGRHAVRVGLIGEIEKRL